MISDIATDYGVNLDEIEESRQEVNVIWIMKKI